jgi:DNA recombination protein RmuC
MSIYFLPIILVILLIIIVILIFKVGRTKEDLLLHQKIDSLKDEFTKNVLQVQSETSKNLLGELSKLYEKIGSLDRESNEILNLTKSFHDILKPTKTRGIFGESILDSIIKDVLPQEAVLSQYVFRNGKKVDFAIKLPQGLVPIDAKFSLDTFKNYLEAPQSERERKKKIFSDSIKDRIEETGSYIFPDEGTTDFSLMYIPSEAVYYFIITETVLLEFAHQKRVFIVGPNTLYAYLKTILIGFQALKVEARAKEIYNSLRRLDEEIKALLGDYTTLGTHLRNAVAKYDEVRKEIEGLSIKLASISKKEE